MIVSAGGGERDINVDLLIVDEGLKRNDREQLLNEKLTTELRPTLFLAQLSNLMAGQYFHRPQGHGFFAHFHGRRGRRHLGDRNRLCPYQGRAVDPYAGRRCISAERLDMILLIEAIQGHALGGYHPIWSRKLENGGGMITGSVGAFLMLESREHAQARGARIYATIDAVGGDRGSREGDRLEQRLQYLTAPAADADPSRTVVFSGTTGFPDLAAREKAFLDAQFPKAAVRAYGGLVGHALESQFPLGLAFAALSLGAGAKVPPSIRLVRLRWSRPQRPPSSQRLVMRVAKVSLCFRQNNKERQI